jgi:hypothetical protein
MGKDTLHQYQISQEVKIRNANEELGRANTEALGVRVDNNRPDIDRKEPLNEDLKKPEQFFDTNRGSYKLRQNIKDFDVKNVRS